MAFSFTGYAAPAPDTISHARIRHLKHFRPTAPSLVSESVNVSTKNHANLRFRPAIKVFIRKP